MVSLSGTAFVLLCIVLVFVAAPVAAQDSGGIPPGTAANGVDTGGTNDPPDVVVVAADACTVSPGASIILEDGDGTRARFVDGEKGITISNQDGSLRIEGPVGDFIANHATSPDTDTSFDTDGDYKVVASTGITCEGGDDGTTPADDQYDGPVDDQYGPIDDPGGKPGGPTGDVDSPEDVVDDTIVGKQVPNTGGPPLAVLAGAAALLTVGLIAGLGILRR